MPPSPAADRNLLFGILALQMDFISRDALIAAMNAWVLDKAKPLGDVLRDSTSLAADEHALLDALVQQAPRAARQRPAAEPGCRQFVRLRCATTCGRSPTPTCRPAWSTSPSARTGTDPYATTPRIGPPSPRRTACASASCGRTPRAAWRGVRGPRRGTAPRGGPQGDPGAPRRPAGPAAAASCSRRRSPAAWSTPASCRFTAWATTPTAGPSTPCASSAATASRTPSTASTRPRRPGLRPGERTLRLRQLLGRFVDVCNAIAYAHSRGVLHRDLKPGNIMLGKYGETLVVDWGLAKVLDRADVETTEGVLPNPLGGDSALTQAGTAMGTPAYMSPEQAAGRLDRLGPRQRRLQPGGDALLPADRPAAVHRAGRGRGAQEGAARRLPPAAAGADRRSPPALEAVCLKAMALKPEDRYASPHALADDLEHWLADEPVSAYREPWPRRLGRWRRRHRTLVAVAAFVLLTAVVSAAIGIGAVGREQERARRWRRGTPFRTPVRRRCRSCSRRWGRTGPRCCRACERSGRTRR